MSDALRAPAGVVALRPATPDDAPFLAAVYASTREQELAQMPFTAEQKAAFVAQQFDAQTRHYAQYRNTTFDVVEVGGVGRGRLIVGRWADQVRIVDIALLPEARGVGVGGRLIAAVIAEAEAQGLPTTIYVERFNPAQRLYARLGFELAQEDDGGVYLFLERRPAGRPDAPRAQANTAS